LDGVAYAMAPPTLDHQRVVGELYAQLRDQLRGHRCEPFMAPVGVRLPAHQEADEHIRTVFEPDLIVVCDPAKLDPTGVRGAPDVVIEVLSPSTATFDLLEKRVCYDRAGVRELWLIDVVNGLVTRYEQEVGTARFGPAEMLRASGRITVAALEGLVLDLEFISSLPSRNPPEGWSAREG
jgi:Uma2 family endonuclease